MEINQFINKFVLVFFFIINTNILFAQTSNTIIAKVDNQIITSTDLENEIKTILLINNIKLTNENFSSSKNLAINSLIRRSIKKSEIERFETTRYSSGDLKNYIEQISKNLNVSKTILKNLFSHNNLDYDLFVEGVKIDLIWNSLIFQLYAKQININTIEVENELKKRMELQVQKTFKIAEIEFKNTENIKKIIQDISRLNNENKFEEAVKKYSISPSAVQKGNLGWIDSSNLNKIYNKRLRSIQVGKITAPIITANKIVILKLIDQKNMETNITNLEVIKKTIIEEKKQEKLEFFSNSHFNKLKNSFLIVTK